MQGASFESPTSDKLADDRVEGSLRCPVLRKACYTDIEIGLANQAERTKDRSSLLSMSACITSNTL